MFGPALEVKTLRLVATPLAVISLLGAAALGIGLLVSSSRGKATGTQRPTLVSVATVVSDGPRISVSSLQELEKLARNNTVFVRQFGKDSRVYFVHEGSAIYQFAIGDVPEDWIETRGPAAGAAAAAANAAPAPQTEPEVAEQIPAWLTAEGQEEPGTGEGSEQTPEAAATAAMRPDNGAAVMEAALVDGETRPGANGHYPPSDNGDEPPEAQADEPAEDEPAESTQATIEEQVRAEEDAVEDAVEEAGVPERGVAGETVLQTRPAYVRNRQGAERARAWLKRKYGTGRLGEQPSRPGEKSEIAGRVRAGGRERDAGGLRAGGRERDAGGLRAGGR